jgi:hypothetical protein
MMQAGIIQPRSSSFSSSVQLAKNDESWRFYIDYRGLNAIIVIGRFSLPVIDELMDELS